MKACCSILAPLRNGQSESQIHTHWLRCWFGGINLNRRESNSVTKFPCPHPCSTSRFVSPRLTVKLPVCSPRERQTGSFAAGAVLGEMERWQWPRLNALRLRSAAPEELLSSSQDHSHGREEVPRCPSSYPFSRSALYQLCSMGRRKTGGQQIFSSMQKSWLGT